ncbi:MAG: YihY/virulence factor BrkB family protein, partial [Bacteroidota bacterium]
AYYTVFSILPMIMIVISIFGIIWGEAAVSGEVYQGLSNTLGEDAAQQIQEMISNQHKQHRNIITMIVGFATLALGATGMFNQLHSAFNNIWGIAAKPRSSLLAYASKYLVAFSILIATFFLLLLSLAVNSFLIKYGPDFTNGTAGNVILEHLISYLLVASMFALMFKFLGDALVHWKLALMGGLFTAALFLIGKFAIGWYIGRSNISSTFGSASVLALLMIWVYYTSQILFLGASFLYVLGEKLGLQITANKDAVSVVKQEIDQ